MREFDDRMFEAFVIDEIDGPHILGRTIEGKMREFEMVIHRNLATNALTIDVVPHFTAPETKPWFDKSEPWTPQELLGRG